MSYEHYFFGKVTLPILSNKAWSNVAGSQGVVKYRLSQGHIVLGHESELIDLNLLEGWTLGLFILSGIWE